MTDPRFEVITDHDNLPSILDHELNQEALFLGHDVAEQVAGWLNDGTQGRESYAWRAARPEVTR